MAFLSTLHWPQDGADLGVVELPILYGGRSISVSAVLFGPGTDIWRSCRFLGGMLRALGTLPGGMGRLMPCSIGANHCRLGHVGWEKCGHGLTSWPRESASEGFSNELLVLFGYLSGSAAALLGGELPLRCCSGKFACRVPTWGLPARAGVEEVSRSGATSLVLGYLAWLVVLGCLVVGGFLGALKEFGYTGKPLHTLQDLAGMGVLSLVQGSGTE